MSYRDAVVLLGGDPPALAALDAAGSAPPTSAGTPADARTQGTTEEPSDA